jgi:Calx-beta domain
MTIRLSTPHPCHFTSASRLPSRRLRPCICLAALSGWLFLWVIVTSAAQSATVPAGAQVSMEVSDDIVRSGRTSCNAVDINSLPAANCSPRKLFFTIPAGWGGSVPAGWQDSDPVTNPFFIGWNGPLGSQPYASAFATIQVQIIEQDVQEDDPGLDLEKYLAPFAGDTVAKTINVPIINDSIFEGNETVNLALSNPTGGATLGVSSTAVLTIMDDDPAPSISINDVSVTEGNTATVVNAVFTATLSSASGHTITVSFSTANGTATGWLPDLSAGNDYVAQSGTLTFNPGETTKTITVVVLGDTVDEPNETFFVNLTTASNATILKSQGVGTIISDDFAMLSNISTRGNVLTGDNVMIGGFIIGGSAPLRVLVRSRGPAMGGAPFVVPRTLANPFLQLFSGPTVIAQNDNWQDAPSCSDFVCEGATAIMSTGLDPCQPNPGQTVSPPNCALESAILITLPPGGYTAHVTGADGGSGVALVEVFEADTTTLSELSNISTRGFVQTGDNVMIGGLIIEANFPKTVLIRARGPSMGGAPFFVPGTLGNPFLELYSGQTLIAFNDNWRERQEVEVLNTGLDPCQPSPGEAVAPPGCNQESALLLDLPAGGYTSIVTGVGGTTGIGLVEVFEVAEVNTPNVLGTYRGSSTVTLSNCQNLGNNGTFGFSSVVNINSQNGSRISGAGTFSGPTSVNLNFSGTVTAAGQHVMGSFTFMQPGGSGSGTSTGFVTNTLTLNFTGQFTFSSGDTCALSGSTSGIR